MFWDYMDAMTYLSMHAFFLKTDFSQKFWAIMNSRIADNTSHALYILILVRYVFSDEGRYIKRRSFQALFVILAVVMSVIVSKGVQSELSNHFSIKRDSPSLVLSYDVKLSTVLPGLENVKDASRRSFPGDHAMTLLLLCSFIFWLTNRISFRIITLFVTVLFIMPRLISGGHWFTDILMGSLPIAMFALTLWISVYSVLVKYFVKKDLRTCSNL